MRCVIVDDEPWALELLKSYIASQKRLELVFSSQSSIEALNYINKEPVDLLFLDIQMPEMTGLQLMSLADRKIPIIITSAYSEYALEGYSFHVIDYLLKPIELTRFIKAIQKAESLLKLYPKEDNTSKITAKPFLFIKTDGRLCKVLIEDILYLEAKRDYVLIQLANESLLTLDSLNNLELELTAYNFFRVHKSYLISLQKINFIEGNRVLIEEKYIPIGDTYKKKFLQHVSFTNK